MAVNAMVSRSLLVVVVVLAAVVVVSASAASTLTFHQGGYNQLQVALAPQTPVPSNCSQMLHQLEMVVRESSRLLHQSTDGRTFIRSVNVLLPAAWGDSAASICRRNVSRTRTETYNDADVRVSANAHPLMAGGADSIWTQQSRDCGQQGDYISAGPEFFFYKTESTDMWIRGRRFLREFAKYRYGVFDEVDHRDDGLFPLVFCDPLAVTNATGRSIQSSPHRSSGCDQSSAPENCLGSSSNASSSSGSNSRATAFCDASSHDDMAPTQHNLLCQGQSVKDVVFSHQDLKSTNGQVFNRLETVFHYKQAASPRFVLALDKSSPMDERDHWKYVRSATRRLVLHDLADDTELGILSFADSVQIHTNDGAGSSLVRLTGSGSREAVASAIPVFISSGASSSSGSGSGSGAGSGVVVSTSGQESCLTCALAEAIAMLERSGSPSAGDVIILITTGSSSGDQVQSALALASRKQVRVSVVAFAYVPTPSGVIGSSSSSQYSYQAGALRNLQSLAEATGGRMTAVASKGVGTMSHISMLVQLGDALVATLEYHQGSDNVPALVHEQEFGSDSAQGWVNGTFYMDPSLGRDTVMAVYFYSRDFNTHVGDIRLVSPDGVEHRGISETAMASLYVTPLAPIDKSGVWRYSFDRRSQSHQSHFVKVTSKLRVRSSPASRGPLTAKLRIVSPASGDAPFILLATVKSGELPVLDARVRAIIQYTGTSAAHDSSVNNTQVLELLDNGNADPDITRGDGVYTRYFGRYFKGAGTYSVTLSVDAMDGRAYTIRSGTPSSHSNDAIECCGSVIRVPLDRRELTGAFSRLIPGGIITAGNSHVHFPSVPSTNNASWPAVEETVDLLPPSRVTDLRVHVEPTTQRVTFQWTAVGDDFDVGTAYTYELRLASNKTWLRIPSTFQQAEALPGSTPRASGEVMDLTLMDFDRYDRYFYAAVRAVDRRGNRGRISNLVQLWMPSPPTTTTQQPAPLWPSSSLSVNDLPPQWFSGGGLSTVHWAAIVAGICVALLILILAVYFVVAAKRRKDKEQQHNNINGTTKSGPPKFAYVPTTTAGHVVGYPTSPESHLKSASTNDLPTGHQNGTDMQQDHYRNTGTLQSKEILSQYQSGAVTIYDGRTVPVHWSASQLLQEHERRHSPYGQNEPSASPVAGEMILTPNDSAFISGSYHLNSGSAIYGGLIHPDLQQQQQLQQPQHYQQQPQHYQSSASSATPPSDYRPYSVDYEGSSSTAEMHDTGSGVGVNGGYYPAKPARPPTFPKPGTVNNNNNTGTGRLMSHLPHHGSFTSLASERKKQRNVTQV